MSESRLPAPSSPCIFLFDLLHGGAGGVCLNTAHLSGSRCTTRYCQHNVSQGPAKEREHYLKEIKISKWVQFDVAPRLLRRIFVTFVVAHKRLLECGPGRRQAFEWSASLRRMGCD